MSIRYFSADWIFPVSSKPLKNGVLAVDNSGLILNVLSAEDAKKNTTIAIEYHQGVLVPGFINAHCHLELSHLFGLMPEQTGLPKFVNGIVAHRNDASEMQMLEAMKDADQKMYSNGVVAVGDISNVSLSKEVKKQSKLYYHTFVEVFGFDKPSQPIIENALQIQHEFASLKTSIVPHAPYSVSIELLDEIKNKAIYNDVLSIHNQETLAETEFFEEGTGDFALMYKNMGVAKATYHGNGQNSLEYFLPRMPQNNLILVHNTFSEPADLGYAEAHHAFLYWCLCPNANLYIENNLPNADLMANADIRVVLGTDSLASNHQLSILDEMRVLQENSKVTFEKLLQWATLNGAKALNIQNQFGSFQREKRSGVVLLELDANLEIKKNTKIRRLI